MPTGDSCTAAHLALSAGEMGEANHIWLARGNTILNSVKTPGSVATSMLPPCCFTMMSWLIDRPSPVPSPEGFGREKRVEYLFLHVGGDSGAVVADADFDAIAEIFWSRQKGWGHNCPHSLRLCASSPRRSRSRSG